MDVRFHMGSNMIVAGPTDAGKSFFVVSLIRNKRELFDNPPDRVYWYYGVHTAMHDDIKDLGVTMHKGIPDDFENLRANSMIVIDDLMDETKKSEATTKLFTGLAHHKPFFVVFIIQNLFFQSKEMRTRSLNAQYFVLFKNPRDARQINYLGRQIYPNKARYMTKIYDDATVSPHSYLLVDLHKKTSELVRLRTRVMPYEQVGTTLAMPTYVDKQAFDEHGCL